ELRLDVWIVARAREVRAHVDLEAVGRHEAQHQASGLRLLAAERAERAVALARIARHRYREPVVLGAADRHEDRLVRGDEEGRGAGVDERCTADAVVDAGELRRAAAHHLAREVEPAAVAVAALADARKPRV